MLALSRDSTNAIQTTCTTSNDNLEPITQILEDGSEKAGHKFQMIMSDRHGSLITGKEMDGS